MHHAVILRCEPHLLRRASKDGGSKQLNFSSTAPACEFLNCLPVRSYQRLFLGPAPALDLPFSGYGIGDTIKMLRPHQFNGPSGKSIARKVPLIVLIYPYSEIITGCAADIKRLVGTKKNINERAHQSSSFEARKGSHLRMTTSCILTAKSD